MAAYKLRMTAQRKRKLDKKSDWRYTKPPKKSKKAPNTSHVMRITALDDDCLREIFKDFDINDLTSVAEASKRFMCMAREIFQRKHAKTVVTVYSDHDRVRKSTKSLKQFGDLVTKLNVVYTADCRRYDKRLETAIATHCHDSLMELTLNDVGPNAFATNCFKKVQKVCLNGGSNASLVSNLNTVFPAAVSLSLVKMNFASDEDLKCWNQHFPSLIRLTAADLKCIVNNSDQAENMFTVRNLRQVIAYNPQLKSLKIIHDAYAKQPVHRRFEDIDAELFQFIEFINAWLPKLRLLSLNLTTKSHQRRLFQGAIRPHANYTVHFKKVKKLKIIYDACLGLPQFCSDQLAQLIVVSVHRPFAIPIARQYVTDIVRLNGNIDYLCISGTGDENFPFEELLGSLPKLKELVLVYPLEYDEIDWILNSCATVTTFHVFRVPTNTLELVKAKSQMDGADSKWRFEETRDEAGVMTTFFKN